MKTNCRRKKYCEGGVKCKAKNKFDRYCYIRPPEKGFKLWKRNVKRFVKRLLNI